MKISESNCTASPKRILENWTSLIRSTGGTTLLAVLLVHGLNSQRQSVFSMSSRTLSTSRDDLTLPLSEIRARLSDSLGSTSLTSKLCAMTSGALRTEGRQIRCAEFQAG